MASMFALGDLSRAFCIYGTSDLANAFVLNFNNTESLKDYFKIKRILRSEKHLNNIEKQQNYNKEKAQHINALKAVLEEVGLVSIGYFMDHDFFNFNM